MKKILCLLLSASPIFSKTYIVPSISFGAMYQGGVFLGVNQNSGGASYESKRNPYGVPAYLSAVQLGIQTYQGPIYLATHLYYTFNTLNKTIYKNAMTPLVSDSVSMKTKGGGSGAIHLGWNNNHGVIPYGLIGLEYAYRSFTYKATNLSIPLEVQHRKPIFIVGLGVQGQISKNIALGLNIQRKMGQEFDVQIPISAGYPSLSNHRLKVGTSHFAIVANISYRFSIG